MTVSGPITLRLPPRSMVSMFSIVMTVTIMVIIIMIHPRFPVIPLLSVAVSMTVSMTVAVMSVIVLVPSWSVIMSVGFPPLRLLPMMWVRGLIVSPRFDLLSPPRTLFLFVVAPPRSWFLRRVLGRVVRRDLGGHFSWVLRGDFSWMFSWVFSRMFGGKFSGEFSGIFRGEFSGEFRGMDSWVCS